MRSVFCFCLESVCRVLYRGGVRLRGACVEATAVVGPRLGPEEYCAGWFHRLACIVSLKTRFETWWWPSAKAETCCLINKHSTFFISCVFDSTTYTILVYLCVLCGSENKQWFSLYSTDWLVFINETECIYCTVCSTFYVLPTQCLYVFCVDLRTNSDYFTVQHWLVGFYNWDGVCLLRGTFYILRSAHTVYLCVLCGSENKQQLFHCTALTDWFL
jgi:hypothetical protein